MEKIYFVRKLIMLILAIVFLTFGIQCISSGQLPISPDKIKDGSTGYVVWIVTDIATDSGGSGVLIDKNNRLVVTNAHVTGDDKEVQVFFAVRDSSGNVVRARPFYKNKDHQNTLQRLGYVTRGRVIAKYQYPGNEPDLAIIELDGLPETVSPLELLTSIDYSKMTDEPIHILGHPTQRDLWHWKAGFFKENTDRDLLVFADAYFGNSGGPVLNKDGKLIGITRAIIKDKGITFAVPISAIIDLRKTLEPVKIFSIYNNTELPMSYEIKWEKDEDWKKEKEPLETKKERLYSRLSKDISTEYPKIRFEDAQNSKEASESIQKLETKYRLLGIGIKDVKDFDSHIEINDSLRYQFMSDPETKKISLVKMKLVQTFIIHNNTKSPIFFQYRWHEDEKWKEEYIKPDERWKYGQPAEKVFPGYPKIRFDEISGDRNYPEKSSSLLTQTGYFDKTTKIKDDIKQMGWNPPLYYQFKNNPETNGIFLDEMRYRQTFSIQNATDTYIFFKYKWHENNNWQPGYVYPNQTKDFSQPSDNISPNYATINYSENVSGDDPKISYAVGTDDDKSSEKSNRLETQKGYFGKNTEITADINQIKPSGFHFKYNSKTKKLTLYQGLLTNSKKSTGRSFPFLPVVFNIAVVVATLAIVTIAVIVVIFPERHIFSIQNNTEITVDYHTKWTKKGDWKLNSLAPGKSRNHWWTGSLKKVPQDHPKARFDSTADDKNETTEYSLETYTWRLGPKGIKKISREKYAREYHFELNPETEMLELVDSEENGE